MIQRCKPIYPQIKIVDAVEELVPTEASQRKLLELLKHMTKFNSVTKNLQCDAISLSEVRLLFNYVIADYTPPPRFG